MCELDGFMYVTGGAESWNCLNTVERYNPENNTWTLVAPMNVARRGAGVAVHAGEMTINKRQAAAILLTAMKIHFLHRAAVRISLNSVIVSRQTVCRWRF